MKNKALYESLVSAAQSVIDGDGDAVVERMQVWLKDSIPIMSRSAVEAWNLDWYASIALEDYPVWQADAGEELLQLIRFEPSTEDSLAMAIRDVFWHSVSLETAVECPRCRDEYLRVLVKPSTDEIVLACDACSWAQTTTGRRWEESELLRPASRSAIGNLKLTNPELFVHSK
ncbi:MAG: hypothetical protein MUE69_08810 [Myxococcota bacterium]|jgi:hypothetical protein|nr:hypothetical protein [Myxococcota bacterium]